MHSCYFILCALAVFFLFLCTLHYKCWQFRLRLFTVWNCIVCLRNAIGFTSTLAVGINISLFLFILVFRVRSDCNAMMCPFDIICDVGWCCFFWHYKGDAYIEIVKLLRAFKKSHSLQCAFSYWIGVFNDSR